MNENSSRDAGHFDRIYARNPDPWGFLTSPYEQRKYDVTLAALGGQRFNSAFEAGCSIGVLTTRLAKFCSTLLAVDISKVAVNAARERCAPLPQVKIELKRFPSQWPRGMFDLILLSEVLYFLTPADIQTTARHCIASLLPGGQVLLVNYTGLTDDPCSGDDAAEIFMKYTAPVLALNFSQRHDNFRIDLLQKHK